MPKIPTYKTSGLVPTAEAPSIKTNIQVSPFQTMAGALRPLGKAAEDYYIRERSIAEKAEADKAYLEVSSELDTIQENSGKQFNPEEAISIFNKQSKFIIDERINQIQNKRVKQILQNRFNTDIVRRGLKVKESARNELDKLEEYNYKTKYQQNLSKYRLATSDSEKKIIETEVMTDADLRSLYNGDSKVTKEISFDNIKKDLFKIDFQRLLDEKKISQAAKKIKDIEGSKFLSDADREKLKKDFAEQSKVIVHASALINGIGIVLDDKEKKDAMKFIQSEGKYTEAQIAEIGIKNNAKIETHKNLLSAGFSNAAITGNPRAVESSLNLYRNYRSQGSLPYLKNGMKLTDDELDFYDTMLFMTDTMGESIPNAVLAYNSYYKNKNTTDVKSRFVDAKKVKATADNIVNNWFQSDAKNIDAVQRLVERYANTLIRVYPSDQDKILEKIEEKIKLNFRKDIFDNIVPIKRNRPETHDVSIASYIKKLYDEGRINKDVHDLEDLIAIDTEQVGRSDVSGVQIVNRNYPMNIVILNPAKSDLDQNQFASGIITDKQLKQHVYPLARDARYQQYIFNMRARNMDLESIGIPLIP